MDDFMKRKLDEHISGPDFHRLDIEMTCSCGHTWTASGSSEYGMISLDNESYATCPKCGLVCE